MPKWGLSRGDYFYDTSKRIIAKGLTSIKYMGAKIAEELYSAARDLGSTDSFMKVLLKLNEDTSVDTRQLDILIKLDFFSDFGNQRELLRMAELFYGVFKKGEVHSINKSKVNGEISSIISKYSIGTTKQGTESKSYKILDIESILEEVESYIKSLQLEDLDDILKIQNFKDAMGYIGYTSNKEEDRRKLYVLEVFPICRKKDGVQFGYSIITKSIGSGKESRFSVFNKVYEKEPILKDDIIYCSSFQKEGPYFKLTGYHKIF